MITESTPLLAFHGDKAIKRKYLARVQAHRKADEIISGVYWEKGRGCAIGCTLHSSSHAAYETELGIPKVLARLEDRLFEGLYRKSAAAAKLWPEQFLSAARPGADLSMVWPKFAYWLLIDEAHGVIRHAKHDKTVESIKSIAALYARWIAGNMPPQLEWRAAAAAAYAAATATATATATAAAAAAAAAAAYTATDAAAAYTAAAAAADAATAARGNHFSFMCAKLMELMEAA